MTSPQHYQCRVLLREAALERDGVCQRCGSGRNLETSHIRGVGAFKTLEFEMDNVLMLCHEHHEWFDNNKETSRKWFAEKWPEREEKLIKLQTRVKTYQSVFEIRQKIKENIEIFREINKNT